VVLWLKRDIYVRPPHHSPGLDALSQVDLPLKLLPLCLQEDGHATSEDHIDLPHLLITVLVNLVIFALMGLLWRQHC
jgi:hypothetical protein